MIEVLKYLCRLAGTLLMILAVAILYVCLRQLPGLRQLEDYEDRGVHTFAPYQVLPHQVKNNSSGRTQRMNPTKTVYMIYYREVNGAGYRWSEEAASKEAGRRVVEQGQQVRRRVLAIPAEGTYLTIDPELSAEAYANGLRRRYLGMMWAAIGYLVFYLLAWGLIWAVKKQKADRERSWED